MSKTVDELVKVYDDAYSKAYDALAYDVSEEDEASKRAGIAAVIRALRDEFREEYGMWERFTEILGDAGEKVAEAPDLPTRTVQLTGITKSPRPDVQFEPATVPAPAGCDVCRGTGFVYVRTMHDPDGPREKEVCEECHAPAPDVCEWTYKPDEVAMPPTSCVEAISVSLGGKWVCTGCLQPIKFTEAK